MGPITRGHLLTLSKTPKNTKSTLSLITVTLDVNDNSSILSNGKDTQMQTTHGNQQTTYTLPQSSKPITERIHWRPSSKIKEDERNAKSPSDPSSLISANTSTLLQHVFPH